MNMHNTDLHDDRYRLWKSFFAAFCAVVLSASSASAGWTYDAAAQTVTDGFWTFAVTKANGTDLTVNGSTGSVAGDAPDGRGVDFSDVKDASGTSYRVVEFKTFSGQRSTSSTLWGSKGLLTEFKAPHCLKLSDQYAFSGCTSLTNVQLDSSAVVTVAGAAFDGCTALERFEPRTLSGASTLMFNKCAKLSGEFTVTGSGGFGKQAFAGTGIEGVSGPETPTLGDSAFSGCVSLFSAVFPKVKTIGHYAFKGCSSLATISFPSVTQILVDAFNGCAGLDENAVKSLLHPGLKDLGAVISKKLMGGVFYGCTGIKGTLVWNLPNLSTNAVPPDCFYGCTGISRVEFKTPVCEIGAKAFRDVQPGAEILMGRSVISVFGQEAVGTVKPYAKLYVADDSDEMFAAMVKSQIVIRKDDFRNTGWITGYGSSSVYTWNWTTSRMRNDTDICDTENIDGTNYPKVKDKNVIGFLAYNRHCWVIKMSKKSLTVFVK